MHFVFRSAGHRGQPCPHAHSSCGPEKDFLFFHTPIIFTATLHLKESNMFQSKEYFCHGKKQLSNSGLENSMGRGAWWTTVHRVAKSHSAQLSHTCECVWFKSNIYVLVFLKGEAHRRKAFFCRVRMHSPGGGSMKSLVSPESPGLGALGGITPVPEGQRAHLSPAGALQVRSWSRCLLTPNQQGESRIYQQPQDTALRRRISDWRINFLSLLGKAALRLKPRNLSRMQVLNGDSPVSAAWP